MNILNGKKKAEDAKKMMSEKDNKFFSQKNNCAFYVLLLSLQIIVYTDKNIICKE